MYLERHPLLRWYLASTAKRSPLELRSLECNSLSPFNLDISSNFAYNLDVSLIVPSTFDHAFLCFMLHESPQIKQFSFHVNPFDFTCDLVNELKLSGFSDKLSSSVPLL